MTWNFTTPQGSFETDRVHREVGGEGKGGTTGSTLRVVLSAEQAKKVEESLGRQAAVVSRDVPDGDDFVQDTTGGENVFTIEPPSAGQDLFTPGDYVVESWEGEWRDSQFYEYTLEVSLETPLADGFGRTFGRYFGS